MRKAVTIFILMFLPVFAGAWGTAIWTPVSEVPQPVPGVRKIMPPLTTTLALDTDALKSWLAALSTDPAEAGMLTLPVPDGSFREFKIWMTPIMEPALADKYPDIKTFTGYAADNRFATVKLDITPEGFHAIIYEGAGTYAIDPYSSLETGFYNCYYKKDYPRPEGKLMLCELAGDEDISAAPEPVTIPGLKLNGTVKKTYRLALACTGEYAVAVAGSNPTKAAVLSAMVTTMNRVNGIYERELAVTMILVANNDTLIFLNSGTDPYSNSSGGTMLGQNQTTVTSYIGSANYDIGHVFSTGGGGIANLGCVCRSNNKARGVTGSSNPVGDFFDVDYVAHEMGHQYGANHTFNANTSSCSGNGVGSSAYEPGSGSTIMAYAGICGSANNIQQNSDDYFHAKSLLQMTAYITTAQGSNCPVTASAGNTPPALPSFTQTYYIPFLTPFELIAPESTDPDHDSLWYCWEQWNLGNFRSSWAAANLQGPIFRSFQPDTARTRVFTTPLRLVNNITSYIGEKLPEDDRSLTFKLTVRDMLNGWGTFNFPDDSIKLNVVNTGNPFEVTTPNSAVTWNGGSTQTVTWNVSGTDQAPINCTHVDIYLSTDNGYTYPVLIAQNTPNDGSEAIVVPNIGTTSARIKVKGSGNVFFDISNQNFTITFDPNSIPEVSWGHQVQVYPVPATDILSVKSNYASSLQILVSDVSGRSIWQGTVSRHSTVTIPLSGWAGGIYLMQLTDRENGQTAVKRIAVQ